MTAPEPAPELNLWTYVHDLYVAADRPTLRYIAQGTGVSHTTVADIIHGRRRSTWNTVSALVHFLKGDLDHAQRLWDDLFVNDPKVDALTVAGRTNMLATLEKIRGLLEEIRDRLPESPNVGGDERDSAEHVTGLSAAPTGVAGGGESTDALATA